MAPAVDEAEILWTPDSATIAAANFTRVLQANGVADYGELTTKLQADPSAFEFFYRTLIQSLELDWQKKPDVTFATPRGPEFAEWFPGAEFNAPANCVDRWVSRGRGDATALVWEDEAGAERTFSFLELQRHIRACAAALQSFGVGSGTCVGLWMPMVPEAAIALLAIGYIGAIAVPAFSGYGEAALATRLADAGITVLIAADTLARRGKRTSTLDTLVGALDGVPTVKSVLLWTRIDEAPIVASDESAADADAPTPSAGKKSWRASKPGMSENAAHSLDDALHAAQSAAGEILVDPFVLQAEEATVEAFARQVGTRAAVYGWYASLTANAERAKTLRPAVMKNTDPYLLLYTSGSTGKPKGVVHPHTGFPIKVAIDQHLCFDVKPGDRMLWYTDMGWMMAPFLILGALMLGASVVMYDGTPDFPTPGRLWEVAAKHRVTHLGLAPTAVRALVAHGDSWPQQHDLSALRILGSSGEPWNTTPYRWFLHNVGRDVAPIINYSGGTEIGGGILGCFPTMPLAANAFHGPIPGMIADVVDAGGQSVRGDVGELILRAPWPGMTQSLWGGSALARDDERFLATYWQRLPGIWTHGDWAEVATNVNSGQSFWYIRGRSDDTINVAGKRVGPAEFESVLCGHPLVREAAAIAVPDALKGDVVVCLVVTRDEVADFESLRQGLFALVDHELGHALRPKAIKFVDELPKTRNQKVLRRVARAQYLQLSELGDLSGLENPSALAAISRAR